MSQAALYARISSLKDDKGVSIERQIDECLKLAKSHGFDVAKEWHFIDNGRSGKNLKRPAVQRLIQAIQQGRVTHLFGWDIARLSRSVSDTAYLLELFTKHGVTFLLVNGFSDTTTPEGELLTGFQAQMAQYWRKKVSKEIRGHYNHLRAAGVYLGRKPPFGLRLVGNGKQRHIIPDPETFPVVLAFLKLYASEKAFAHIRGAALLTADGLLWRTRQGIPRPVTPPDLQRLIRNLDLYLPHLPPTLAKQAARVRDKRRNHKENSNVRKHDCLLRRIITCETCGEKLWMETPERGRFSYRHSYRGCAYRGKTISARFVESIVLARLSELEQMTAKDRAKLRQQMLTPPADPFYAQRLDRLRIQNQMEKLVDEWLEVGLTPAQFHKKQNMLQSRLAALPAPPPPPQARSPQEVDTILSNLSANLVKRIRANVSAGNLYLALLFSSVTFHFGTRKVTSKFVWE